MICCSCMFKMLLKFTAVLLFCVNVQSLVASVDDANDDSTLDIAAFNVRIFGVSKVQSSEVVKNLIRILIRYDLILLQEIRDSTGRSIRDLLALLSKEVSRIHPGASYGIQLSPRLGRTNSKEEYAYIYRKDLLTLKDSFTFNDVNDIFEREPFIARFNASLFAVQDFAVAGVHTSPRDAQNEISNMTQVYDVIKRKWKLNNAILMGDFNAGCTYVKDWSRIRLATDRRFYWIIDHSKDTTAEKSDCPYDRIVVTGDRLLKSIIPHSGGVFYYDEEFSLSRDQALKVSDHYPVHMQIKLQDEDTHNWFSESITVHDERISKLLLGKPRDIYRLNSKAKTIAGYHVSSLYKKSGGYSEILVTSTAISRDSAMKNISKFRIDFPEFISKNQINIAKRFVKSMNKRDTLAHGHGRYKTLYDYYKGKVWKSDITLICGLENLSRPQCQFTVAMTLK